MVNRVKLLFAGKVISEGKPLSDCNVMGGYWLHAIIKDNPHRAINIVRNNQPQNPSNRKSISNWY